MATFWIRSGLGGGFGGCENECWEEIEARSHTEAMDVAEEQAKELYHSFAGMHGLRDIDTIMEEEDCDEDEAESILAYDIDSWIEFEAVSERPEDY